MRCTLLFILSLDQLVSAKISVIVPLDNQPTTVQHSVDYYYFYAVHYETCRKITPVFVVIVLLTFLSLNGSSIVLKFLNRLDNSCIPTHSSQQRRMGERTHKYTYPIMMAHKLNTRLIAVVFFKALYLFTFLWMYVQTKVKMALEILRRLYHSRIWRKETRLGLNIVSRLRRWSMFGFWLAVLSGCT